MSASIPQVEQFELPHPSGEGAFQISLSRPSALGGALPEGLKAPILFVTDGDMCFASAAAIARFRAMVPGYPQVLVVAVGYGANFLSMARLRTGDLTPPLSEAGLADFGALTDVIGDKSGGSDAYLDFIEGALTAEVLARCPEADPERTILFGHSLGGLFTAYALLTRPHAFSAFIASSPSLWWDGFVVLKSLEGFGERVDGLPKPPRVLVAAGGLEQDLPAEVPPGVGMTLDEVHAIVVRSRMIDAAAEFAEFLRAAGLSEVAHVCFQGEDHGSVVPAALMRGLTHALDGWKTPAAEAASA